MNDQLEPLSPSTLVPTTNCYKLNWAFRRKTPENLETGREMGSPNGDVNMFSTQLHIRTLQSRPNL